MCVRCKVYLNKGFCANKVQLGVELGPFPFQNKQFMNKAVYFSLAFIENEKKIKENENCIEEGKINRMRNSLPLSVIFW